MGLRFFSPTRTDATKFALLISLALTAGWTVASPATAGDLVVRYDQSQLLRLPRAATEVIIGNPSIADVALQGGNLLVVTGKTFGITNVIALDADRNVIQDQRVLVERDDRRVVNLHKGGSRYTYSCTPNCEPNLTIGDDFGLLPDHQQAQLGQDQVLRVLRRQLRLGRQLAVI